MYIIPTQSYIYCIKIEDWHFDVPDFYVITQGDKRFYVPKDWTSVLYTQSGNVVGIAVNEKYRKWLPIGAKLVSICEFFR